MKRNLLALCLALLLALQLVCGVFAANTETAVIDTSRTGSISLYKYDLTSAEADGVWNNSYVSTGVYDEAGVNAILGNPSKVNDLGNGEISYGYALKGVEFLYLKIADISAYATASETMVLYGMTANDTTAAFLAAIGLDSGDCYAPASSSSVYRFSSDTLTAALRQALLTNATTVKNALEQLARADGTAMPETDSYGHTAADALPLGLYLLVESRVPENVTVTTDPFLLSVPMTSVNGSNADNGGEEWLYDLTVYPKNATGNPDLEKTVREAKADTGKHEGTSAIGDGYAHTATASAGDVVEYQILSHLPTITSAASYLTEYTFTDTLSEGVVYNKNDIVLAFYADAACTQRIAVWKQTDTKFTVSYASAADGETMTISMTAAGLRELNTAATVYDAAQTRSGYSDCYLRITYAATVQPDAILGDSGNPNEVVLRWKRTNSEYYDTLQDDCHVFTYGLDLTKEFSDKDGNFAQVEFVVYNETDGYFVQAAQNNAGIYEVTDHAAREADATHFIPTADGSIVIRGLEDDAYTITEVKTDDGYTLLKDDISVVISTAAGEVCGVCGKPLLTASATVNGTAASMTESGGSVHALVPLTVVNSHGFDLPQTGDNGTLIFTISGITLAALSLALLLAALCSRRKKKTQ